ncbi:MAG: tandem-95 repeat protein [Magnetococcales bacterium]|nr:tandem-95 repeat protein [Magnetococcales bacterium]
MKSLAALISLVILLFLHPAQAALTANNVFHDATWSGHGRKSYRIPTNAFNNSDGGPLTFSATQSNGLPLPPWLQCDAKTGWLAGNPPDGTQPLTLRITASNNAGERANATFKIFFNATNDAPVATRNIPDQNWTGPDTKRFTVPADTFSDNDGDALTFTATQENGAPLPTWLQFNPGTKTFSGNPPAGASPLRLRVTANDGHNGSANKTFIIESNNTNDPPTLQANPVDSIQWNHPGHQAFQFPHNLFADNDQNPLNYSVAQQNGAPLPDWLIFSSSRLTLSGNPPAALSNLPLTITARDTLGDATAHPFTLILGNTNDAPIATPLPVQPTWTPNVRNTFQLPATTFQDPDRDALTLTARMANGEPLPAWLQFSSASRTFSGIPPADSSALTLEVRASDGHAGTASVQVTLNINHPPVATADSLTITGNHPISDTLHAQDQDGDPLTYRLITNGSKGTATITNPSTGAFTYTPTENNGTDRFTFQVNDGTQDSNIATVTVNLPVPNTAPVASNSTLTVTHNAPATGTLIASDAEHDALTFQITDNGAKGNAILTDSATGAFRYTPNADASGIDRFAFQVNDGKTNSNTATITITIDATAGYPAPVPRSGQTVSYRSRDDGALRKGVAWPVPRFTDNDDGTVTDHLTRLVWMKNTNCWGNLTWAEALTKIDLLNGRSTRCIGYTGTHTDWRLPNFKELESLTDPGQRSLASLPSGHPFLLVQSGWYWSATTHAATPANAWVTGFAEGHFFGNLPKTTAGSVWPVRSGP